MATTDHILIVEALGAEKTSALRFGAWIAKKRGAKATLLHTFDLAGAAMLPPERVKEALVGIREKWQEALAKIRSELGDFEFEGKLAFVGEGSDCDHESAAEAALAAGSSADLIVVGSAAPSTMERLWSGSTAARVVRHARCNVLIVPDKLDQRRAYLPIRRILCGVDLSAGSEKAFSEAQRWAGDLRAALHVAHAWRLPPLVMEGVGPQSETWLAMQKQAFDRFVNEQLQGAEAKTHFIDGPAPPKLLDLSDEIEANLLVVGRRGRTGLSRFLVGGITEKILNANRVPTLVVPLK